MPAGKTMTNTVSNVTFFRGSRGVALLASLALVFGFAASSGPAESLSRSNEPARRPVALQPASSAASHPVVIAAPVAVASNAGSELLHDIVETSSSPAARAMTTAEAVPAAYVIGGRHATKPRTIWMEVTAYCACKKCCGSHANGITASGKRVTYNGGHFVAADLRLLPFGTKLIIPGYNNGKPVEVIDRGGAIKGHHIDLFMPTHQQAMQWGRQWIEVTITE